MGVKCKFQDNHQGEEKIETKHLLMEIWSTALDPVDLGLLGICTLLGGSSQVDVSGEKPWTRSPLRLSKVVPTYDLGMILQVVDLVKEIPPQKKKTTNRRHK